LDRQPRTPRRDPLPQRLPRPAQDQQPVRHRQFILGSVSYTILTLRHSLSRRPTWDGPLTCTTSTVSDCQRAITHSSGALQRNTVSQERSLPCCTQAMWTWVL